MRLAANKSCIDKVVSFVTISLLVALPFLEVPCIYDSQHPSRRRIVNSLKSSIIEIE
jgi:hypothetical protein